MEEPLVSICAINYNNSRYLIETLESIRRQTYQNFELLVIDDCSTDNGVELIKEWLKGYDKPYRLIIHEKNRGVCSSSNTAVRNAKGDYISFIATDDIMMPDKIKTQAGILQNAGKDVCGVYSDAYLIKDDGSPRYGWFIQQYKNFDDVPTGDVYKSLITGDLHLLIGTAMLKRACLIDAGFFDESLVYEDYDMWLRLSKNEYKFIFSGYASLKYRLRPTSLRSTIKKWYPTAIRIYAKHLDGKYGDIAAWHIENVAMGAYMKRDKEALQLLHVYKKASSFIYLICIFDRLKIPKPAGKIIVRIVNKYIRKSPKEID